MVILKRRKVDELTSVSLKKLGFSVEDLDAKNDKEMTKYQFNVSSLLLTLEDDEKDDEDEDEDEGCSSSSPPSYRASSTLSPMFLAL